MNRILTILAAIVALGLVLSGCGSSSSSTPSDDPSASGAVRGGLDFEAVQKCLQAAGLDDALPTGVPSGLPSDRPTDRPSDWPSDRPTDRPSGAPSGAPGGGGFAALQDPAVQAALTACGIELPERAPDPN